MTLEMAALLNPSITRAVVASSTMALLSVLKMVVLSVPAPLTILSLSSRTRRWALLRPIPLTLLIRAMFSERMACGKDGLADFVGGQGGQHHSGGSHPDAGDADQEPEEFPFVLGGEAEEEFLVLPDIVVDVGDRLGLELHLLVGLQGDEDAVADAAAFFS